MLDPLRFRPAADDAFERFDNCRTGILEGRLGVGSPVSVGMLDDRLIPLPFLVGAGLAEPDGVRVEPLAFVADTDPTDNLDGLEGVTVVTRRVGMRVCVPSSLLLRDKLDPCLDPLRLNGLEFGFEFPREPPGVIPVLTPTDDFLGV